MACRLTHVRTFRAACILFENRCCSVAQAIHFPLLIFSVNLNKHLCREAIEYWEGKSISSFCSRSDASSPLPAILVCKRWRVWLTWSGHWNDLISLSNDSKLGTFLRCVPSYIRRSLASSFMIGGFNYCSRRGFRRHQGRVV